MKVLYIGHYKEGTGWSNAAVDLIKAIDSVGVDIVCRNVKLTNTQVPFDKKISELESKSLNNIDVCIQHVLPHHLVGTQKFKKNIAHFVSESNKIIYTPWHTYLGLVDEVWVPNNWLKNSLIENGIENVKTVPYAFDMSTYTKKHNSLNFTSNNYKFKFYYICDLNDRKNIESLLRAFHSEFSPHEQVALVLKVKKYGMNTQQLREHCINICNEVKRSLRIYPNIESYHSELVIPDDFNTEMMYALHNSCDCYVSPSHGEGWSIPAFEAMCFGKTPICGKEGGPMEFIGGQNTGFLMEGSYNVCQHNDPAFSELFTGNEEWFCPDEKEMKKAMRFYFENRASIDRTAGLKQAEKFSYTNVGNMIKELLNDC